MTRFAACRAWLCSFQSIGAKSSAERVPSARQAVRLTASVMNRTEPSARATLTPPPCALLGGTTIAMFDMLPGNGLPAQVSVFGGATWLYVVQHISPITQL